MQEDVRDQYEKMLVTLQQKQKETAETLGERRGLVHDESQDGCPDEKPANCF
jgi:hypothetical protein